MEIDVIFNVSCFSNEAVRVFIGFGVKELGYLGGIVLFVEDFVYGICTYGWV